MSGFAGMPFPEAGSVWNSETLDFVSSVSREDVGDVDDVDVDDNGDGVDSEPVDSSSSDRNAAAGCDVSGSDDGRREDGRWYEAYTRGRRRAVTDTANRRASEGDTAVTGVDMNDNEDVMAVQIRSVWERAERLKASEAFSCHTGPRVSEVEWGGKGVWKVTHSCCVKSRASGAGDCVQIGCD